MSRSKNPRAFPPQFERLFALATQTPQDLWFDTKAARSRIRAKLYAYRTALIETYADAPEPELFMQAERARELELIAIEDSASDKPYGLRLRTFASSPEMQAIAETLARNEGPTQDNSPTGTVTEAPPADPAGDTIASLFGRARNPRD